LWPLGRPKCRCKNIKRLLKKISWEGIDWNDVAQERSKWLAFLNTVMNFRMPQNGGGGGVVCRDDFTARPVGVCLRPKPTNAKDVSSAKCFELRQYVFT